MSSCETCPPVKNGEKPIKTPSTVKPIDTSLARIRNIRCQDSQSSEGVSSSSQGGTQSETTGFRDPSFPDVKQVRGSHGQLINRYTPKVPEASFPKEEIVWRSDGRIVKKYTPQVPQVPEVTKRIEDGKTIYSPPVPDGMSGTTGDSSEKNTATKSVGPVSPYGESLGGGAERNFGAKLLSKNGIKQPESSPYGDNLGGGTEKNFGARRLDPPVTPPGAPKRVVKAPDVLGGSGLDETTVPKNSPASGPSSSDIDENPSKPPIVRRVRAGGSWY